MFKYLRTYDIIVSTNKSEPLNIRVIFNAYLFQTILSKKYQD